MTQLVLAGDVGGTKTWLGLFTCDAPRPVAVATRRFRTLEHDGIAAIIARFLEQAGRPQIVAACLGVAGPVRNNASQLTNVPWRIDGVDLAERSGLSTLQVLNDLETMAYAVPWLAPSELAVIQSGTPVKGGTVAVIAPGTGLGEACLQTVGECHHALPSEAGHTDFPARTPRELELVASLTATHGRVALEDVISGPGLVRLHRFTHLTSPCTQGPLPDDPARQPSAVTASALNDRCGPCREALDLFVAALGAETGNLALRTLPRAGLYIGGGIGSQIVPALRSACFLDALSAKGPMRTLVEQIPVFVVLEPKVALIGAAVRAVEIHTARS